MSSKPKILVTGATSGIGHATVSAIAALGHPLVVHGRTPEKAEAVAAELRASASASVDTVSGDLSDLDSVRALVTQVTDAHPDLGVLLNNAGTWFTERETSAQGHERTLAVNHLAPFVLTTGLLPVLRANKARVVTVASMLHERGHMDFDDLQYERRAFKGMAVYSDSKLANVLFAAELARREPDLTSNSLHPGVVKSRLVHDRSGAGAWFFRNVIQRFFGLSADDGAKTSVHLACSADAAGVSGGYFVKSKQTPASSEGQDPAVAKRLWEVTEALVG